MLGELDIRRIRDGLADVNEPLTLVLHTGKEPSGLGDQLAAVAREVAGAGPDIIDVKQGDGTGLPATPALSLAWRGKSNIHYLAVPEGPENLPFLEALVGMPRGAVGIRGEWVRRLARLRRDAELMVFMAVSCPHCARVVREAVHMSLANPQVATVVVDAQRMPELAERYAVKSVPVTVLDRGLALTGQTTADELTELVLSREQEDFDRRVFHSLVECGRFEDAADMIVSGRGGEHFITAWGKSAVSERMGLMLTAERVMTSNPAGLRGLVEGLVPFLEAEDAALRGDTADLLGQIGDPRAAEGLRRLRSDPNPDVAEIAAEALDAIEE